jgi:hypothetical protein
MAAMSGSRGGGIRMQDSDAEVELDDNPSSYQGTRMEKLDRDLYLVVVHTGEGVSILNGAHSSVIDF